MLKAATETRTMEGLDRVEDTLDKFCTGLANVDERTNQNLGDLIAFIGNMKKKLDSDIEGSGNDNYELTKLQTNHVVEAVKQVRQSINVAAKSHRDLHLTVSKIGRNIDKNFNGDLVEVDDAATYWSDSDSRKLLNQAICQHFYIEGMDTVGDSLYNICGDVDKGGMMKGGLIEQRRILEEIKKHNLSTAISWTIIHSTLLKERKSDLEFKMYRQQFLLMVQDRNTINAVMVAKHKFGTYVKTREKEVQTLMGTLAFAGALHKSPYSHLLDQMYWDDLYESFRKESSAILGLPSKSPLAVCFAAGCDATRDKVKFYELAKNDRGLQLLRKQPTVELQEEFFFHSIFACPILKTQVDNDNPPLRLDCGHVISKEALRQSLSFGKKKCPYCPLKTLKDIREVQF